MTSEKCKKKEEKKKIQQSCSIVCLVSGHFVEGLFQFDADFSVFVLPVGEIGDEKFQLLLQLGSFALGGGSLDLGELEVHRQISDLFLGFMDALFWNIIYDAWACWRPNFSGNNWGGLVDQNDRQGHQQNPG